MTEQERQREIARQIAGLQVARRAIDLIETFLCYQAALDSTPDRPAYSNPQEAKKIDWMKLIEGGKK